MTCLGHGGGDLAAAVSGIPRTMPTGGGGPAILTDAGGPEADSEAVGRALGVAEARLPAFVRREAARAAERAALRATNAKLKRRWAGAVPHPRPQ